MAVTITLQAVTPNLLRYKLESDAGGSDVIANATLLADAIPGSPLHQALSKSLADNAAARAYVAGDTMHAGITFGSAIATAKGWGLRVTASTNALVFTPTCEAADADGSYLTIEHRHTLPR